MLGVGGLRTPHHAWFHKKAMMYRERLLDSAFARCSPKQPAERLKVGTFAVGVVCLAVSPTGRVALCGGRRHGRWKQLVVGTKYGIPCSLQGSRGEAAGPSSPFPSVTHQGPSTPVRPDHLNSSSAIVPRQAQRELSQRLHTDAGRFAPVTRPDAHLSGTNKIHLGCLLHPWTPCLPPRFARNRCRRPAAGAAAPFLRPTSKETNFNHSFSTYNCHLPANTSFHLHLRPLLRPSVFSHFRDRHTSCLGAGHTQRRCSRIVTSTPNTTPELFVPTQQAGVPSASSRRPRSRPWSRCPCCLPAKPAKPAGLPATRDG